MPLLKSLFINLQRKGGTYLFAYKTGYIYLLIRRFAYKTGLRNCEISAQF